MARNSGRSSDGVIGHVLKGTLAGAAAMWAMEQVVSYMWDHEDPAAKQRYEQVTEGKYVPDRAAEKVQQTIGLDLTKEQKEQLAMGLHWGVGLTAGVTYALLRRRIPRVAAAQGLLFGLAFSALFDEGATVLFGLAKPPQEYPWQDHARGVVGHLLYGVVADTTLDLLDRAA
jgi:hypothetical protein